MLYGIWFTLSSLTIRDRVQSITTIVFKANPAVCTISRLIDLYCRGSWWTASGYKTKRCVPGPKAFATRRFSVDTKFMSVDVHFVFEHFFFDGVHSMDYDHRSQCNLHKYSKNFHVFLLK